MMRVVRMRPVEDRDVDALVALYAEPSVAEFLWDGVAPSREQVEEVVAGWRAAVPRQLGGWVLEDDGGRVVGSASITPVGKIAEYAPELAGELEVVVALAPSMRGWGHATAVITTLVDQAFKATDAARVLGICDSPNLRSEQMLERAGFQMIGTCAGRKWRNKIFERRRPARPDAITPIETPRPRRR